MLHICERAVCVLEPGMAEGRLVGELKKIALDSVREEGGEE